MIPSLPIIYVNNATKVGFTDKVYSQKVFDFQKITIVGNKPKHKPIAPCFLLFEETVRRQGRKIATDLCLDQ